ncbi:hypothetical protein [Halobacillus sp. BBL2006]|nr:hypothetical protein [Halobacillus sp. BBL2006]
MGCCSPNYHEEVKQKEEEINQAEKESIPFWMKVISILIVLGSLGYYWL